MPHSSKPQPLPGFSHSLHLVHPQAKEKSLSFQGQWRLARDSMFSLWDENSCEGWFIPESRQVQPQVSTLGTGGDGGWDFRGQGELRGQTQGTLGPWQQVYGSDERVRLDKEGTCFPGHSQTKGDRLQRLWGTRRTDERTNLHPFLCLQCRRPRFDSWVGKIL